MTVNETSTDVRRFFIYFSVFFFLVLYLWRLCRFFGITFNYFFKRLLFIEFPFSFFQVFFFCTSFVIKLFLIQIMLSFNLSANKMTWEKWNKWWQVKNEKVEKKSGNEQRKKKPTANSWYFLFRDAGEWSKGQMVFNEQLYPSFFRHFVKIS